jgi:hypothetical protein
MAPTDPIRVAIVAWVRHTPTASVLAIVMRPNGWRARTKGRSSSGQSGSKR